MRLTPERHQTVRPDLTRPAASDMAEAYPPEIASAAPSSTTVIEEHEHPAPKPRRRRHWLRRIVVGVVALLLLIALAVQIVLWTNIPRNLVLSLLQKQLGLRVTADSLSTGWLGNTDLRNVSLSLPLADKAFFVAPHMKVKHTTLFGLLLTRSVALKSIALDNPTLTVLQGQDGTWNIQEVAELVARTGGKQPAQADAKQSARPELPEVHVGGMTVLVKNKDGIESTINPLNVETKRDGPLLYRYDVRVPPQQVSGDDPNAGPAELSIVGRLVPGGNWQHEVEIALANVGGWLRPFVNGAELPPTALAARWDGEANNGAVNGRLVIHRGDFGEYGATGTVLLRQEPGGALVASPQDLLLKTGQAGEAAEVRVASGTVASRGNTLSLQEVIVKAFGGQVRADGSFDRAANAGQLIAQWDRLMPTGATSTVVEPGNLKVSIKTPLPDRPEIYAELNSVGQMGSNKWEVRLAVDGKGRGYQDIDWKLTAQRLAVLSPKQPVVLDGLTATFAQRGPRTTAAPASTVAQNEPIFGALPFAMAAAPAPSLDGGASGRRATTSPATIPADNAPHIAVPSTDAPGAAGTQPSPNANTAPAPAEPAPANPTPRAVVAPVPGHATIALTSLDIPGNRDVHGSAVYDLTTRQWKGWVDVGKMNLPLPWGGNTTVAFFTEAAGDATRITLDDFYVRGQEAQLKAKGDWVFSRPTPVVLHAQADHIPPRFAERDRPPLFGFLVANTDLRGTLHPLNLRMSGSLLTRDLQIGERKIGNVSVKFREGEASEITAERFSLQTEEMELLGGHWDLSLLYPEGGVLGATLKVRDLPISQVVAVTQKSGPPPAVAAQQRLQQRTEERQRVARASEPVGHEQERQQNIELPVTKDQSRPSPTTQVATTQPSETGPVTGTVNGSWSFSIPRPDPKAVTVRGGLTARNVVVAGGAFQADRVEVRTRLAQGTLRLDPIYLVRQAQAHGVEGAAKGSVELDVENFKRIFVDFDVTQWPVLTTPVFRADLTASVNDLTIDLPGSKGGLVFTKGGTLRGAVDEDFINRLRARGRVDAKTDFWLKGQRLGEAGATALLHGRLIEIPEIRVETLDGGGVGTALVDMDKPLESRATVQWQNVNVADIIPYFPGYDRLVGLEGLFDGTLQVGPAASPRALEPMAIRLTVEPHAARYRAVHLGNMQFTAFTDLKDRFVMGTTKETASTIEVAGGVVSVWGRITQHDPIKLPAMTDANRRRTSDTMLLSVDFRNLDLNQLVQAADPTADPMIGRLAGRFRLGGSTRVVPRQHGPGAPTTQPATPVIAGTTMKANAPTTAPATAPAAEPDFLETLTKRLTAEGEVRLTESDLLNFEVVSSLYNLMNVGSDMHTPTGRGTADFRMENGTFYLTNLRYFNRGTSIRAIMQVGQVWDIPRSPISGSAVGTARPLKNFKIPLLDQLDIDQILAIIQSDLTTVHIGGTLKQPQVVPQSFADLGEGMKRLVSGDVSSEVQGSAGQ